MSSRGQHRSTIPILDPLTRNFYTYPGTDNYDYEQRVPRQTGGRQLWNSTFNPDAHWVKRIQYYLQFTPASLDYPWIFVTLGLNFALWLTWLLTDIFGTEPIWISVSFAFAHALHCFLIVLIYSISVMGVQEHIRTAHILKYVITVLLTLSQYASIYSSLSRITDGAYLSFGPSELSAYGRLVRAYGTSVGGLGTINAGNNLTDREETLIVFIVNTLQLFVLTSVVFFKAVTVSQRYEEEALKKKQKVLEQAEVALRQMQKNMLEEKK